MCYFCTGEHPNFELFKEQICENRSKVTDGSSFILNARKSDEYRFNSSIEWSESGIYEQVKKSIFGNQCPDTGLLLFILTCWLDLQAPYQRVWTTFLSQIEKWLVTDAWSNPIINIPRGNFPPVKPHFIKTISILSQPEFHRSISQWFVNTILSIVEERSIKKGNVYIFVQKLCNDIYSAHPNFVSIMSSGNLPNNYKGQHYKRLWMLIMFLLRDQNAIRCLLSRALATVPHGIDALRYWNDPLYFNPLETELPVDGRVQSNWNKLPFSNHHCNTVEQIAMRARMIAREHTIPPSSFDSLLFFG